MGIVPEMTEYKKAKNRSARIGRTGERAAARFLAGEGFEILLSNCRTPRGEIDIVALDGAKIVFIEVKTRYRKRFSSREIRPSANLRGAQKRRIYRAALSYLHTLGDPGFTYRFDIVEVVLNVFGTESILHHPSAFGFEKTHRKRRLFQ